MQFLRFEALQAVDGVPPVDKDPEKYVKDPQGELHRTEQED